MTALKQVPILVNPVHRYRAFARLAVSYFMTIVDLTIGNVALPRMAANSTSPSRICSRL